MAQEIASCTLHRQASLIEDYAAGDMICGVCGRVVGHRVIDVGTEWRSFGNSDKKKNNEDPSRVGQAEDPLLEGGGLSTSVSDMGGKLELPWMRWQHRSNMTGNDRSRKAAFQEIDKMAAKLNVNKVTAREAKGVYKTVDAAPKKVGRSHAIMAAASLYIACRTTGGARTLKEITTIANCSKRDLQRCYREMSKIVKASNGISGVSVSGDSRSVSGDTYLNRFCSKLKLQETFAAKHIFKVVKDLQVLDGKSPTTVAAAVIYMLTQGLARPISFSDVGKVTGAAPGTIQTAYKELYPFRAYLFPADFRFERSLSMFTKGGSPQNEEIGTRRVQQLGLQPTAVEDSASSEHFAFSATHAKTEQLAPASSLAAQVKAEYKAEPMQDF